LSLPAPRGKGGDHAFAASHAAAIEVRALEMPVRAWRPRESLRLFVIDGRAARAGGQLASRLHLQDGTRREGE